MLEDLVFYNFLLDKFYILGIKLGAGYLDHAVFAVSKCLDHF